MSTSHQEGAHFFHDIEFYYVTEDIADESFTKYVPSPSESSHNKRAIIFIFCCPGATARCSLHSLSADSMMPARVV